MSESLVIVSKIREIVKASNKSMGSDVPERLSARIEQLIRDAVQRANENGRQTLLGRDF